MIVLEFEFDEKSGKYLVNGFVDVTLYGLVSEEEKRLLQVVQAILYVFEKIIGSW